MELTENILRKKHSNARFIRLIFFCSIWNLHRYRKCNSMQTTILLHLIKICFSLQNAEFPTKVQNISLTFIYSSGFISLSAKEYRIIK